MAFNFAIGGNFDLKICWLKGFNFLQGNSSLVPIDDQKIKQICDGGFE
jgi:hypothetical protein